MIEVNTPPAARGEERLLPKFNQASCVHLTGHKITRRGDFMLHWAATHIFSSSLPHVTDSRNSRLSANLSQRSRTQKSMTISHQWWYWLNPVLIWLSVIPSHVHILQSTLKRSKQTLTSYIKYSVLLWSSSINKWVNAEFQSLRVLAELPFAFESQCFLLFGAWSELVHCSEATSNVALTVQRIKLFHEYKSRPWILPGEKEKHPMVGFKSILTPPAVYLCPQK